MAQINDNDPPSGGDWFDQQGPPPQEASGGGATLDQVKAAYQELLGRPAESDAVAQNWIAGTGGDLAKIKAGIAATTEGKAFAAKNATPSGPYSDDQILAQVGKWAAMPGADPSLASNPQYWLGAIKEKGGLNPSNVQYWQDASVGPTAFFNNPNREQGGNQFANALGTSSPGAGFGAPPAPYQSNPNAPQYEQPQTPAWLSTPYVAPTWQGGNAPTAPTFTPFKAPTEAELMASPGYNARLNTGLLAGNRSAAAQGTVLNGGTQKALNRFAQDYASNEYSNLFNQDLTTNTTNNGYLQTGFNDASQSFGTNFNIFQTGVQNGLNARQQNEGEFQANVVAPAQQAYANRYASYLNDNARTLNDYLTNYGIQHTADTDYWSRLKDVSGSGLTAAINDKAA